ncbi:hypothetical protein [Halomicrococcus gelatinilyticus]|uniref:hypothetical protein n=1 Tax=Halomicrococcus gelatinilyticus TaxID=1702103 RepID=UPI002E12E683
MADDDGDDGLGFTLPPLRLPAFTLPDHLGFAFPRTPEKRAPVRVDARTVFVAALAFDLLDALVVLLAGAAVPWPRAFVGTLALAPLVGPVALAYAWEAVAATAGLPWLAVAPSATLLVLARLFR